MERHLFKRNVVKDGKKQVRWYYWFFDSDGKQVKKSCGRNGKPCLLKREAEAFLKELEEQDRKNEEAANELKKLRLRDVAENMYSPESAFMRLSEERGRGITPQTMKLKSHYLKVFLGKFGDRAPGELGEAEIEDWLVSLDYSNSIKNQFLTIINEIYSECRRYKIVSQVPVVQAFRRKTKKKDIFSREELAMLFPKDFEKLSDVWKTRSATDLFEGVDGKMHSYGIVFGLMFMLMASTGMRPGEARAVQWEQIKENGIFIDKMIDSNEEVQAHLKKGSADEPKFRAALIPARTLEFISLYREIRPADGGEFIFTYRGKPVGKSLQEKRFNVGLMNTGICGEKHISNGTDGKMKRAADKGGRNLTPHSLRFTYNTYTVNSNLLPGEVLRKMIGHNSAEMTDYYTRTDLDAELRGLQPFQKNVDEIWS